MPKGKRVVQEHRAIIVKQLHSWNYDALLSKTISYQDFKMVNKYIADTFCWQNITGVKQLSIFDELPDYDLKQVIKDSE